MVKKIVSRNGYQEALEIDYWIRNALVPFVYNLRQLWNIVTCDKLEPFPLMIDQQHNIELVITHQS